MAVGDILKEQLLVVEKFTVKENEDIEKGEFVVDDGAGIVAATAALSAVGKVMMALETHDYSEEDTHIITCVVMGCVEAQKVTGTAVVKGDKIIVGATAGECNKYVAPDVPAGGVSTYFTSAVEAAIQANLALMKNVIGTAYAASTDAETTQKLWLGVY